MSVGRPTGADVTSERRLLDVLTGLYDRLIELARTSRTSTVVQAFAAAVDTQVFHGLGRPVTAWTVIDKNATADVWRSTAVNLTPQLFILLQSSAVATVTLRFE